MEDDRKEMLRTLCRDGVVSGMDARLEPLVGGVSSEIYLVTDRQKRFVVKRALEKLKVRDDWFADVSRNESECDYIDYVSRFAPENVPQVVRRGDGYFAMEYLDSGYKNWKTMMLAGDCRTEHARVAGSFLANVHRFSRGDESAARRFDNGANFHDLRIEPYLITTGQRHPELKSQFDAEAERLANSRVCLIHGDFSPKNMLVKDDRLVVLDCEVANYGDPVFDFCFLMTHLSLKALFHVPNDVGMDKMIDSFRESYFKELEFSDGERSSFAKKAGRLLAMLLLARIDGKSPVEYIQDEATKDLVRGFVYKFLEGSRQSDEELVKEWIGALDLE